MHTLKQPEKEDHYQTSFTCWRAAQGDLAGWQLNGARQAKDGSLELDFASAQVETDPCAPGTYMGKNFYNGKTYQVGEVTSPVVKPSFNFVEAIASWNVETPAGAWVEMLVQAQLGGRWTKWYNLGVWASGSDAVARHSVKQQGDTDGKVAVDTLVITHQTDLADAARIRLRLFSADRVANPKLRNAALTFSTAHPLPTALHPGNPAYWNHRLNVPACSQMIYPDGGNVWCSPTAVAMVLGFWGQPGPCEARVRTAVAGVYDWVYDGHGNWPFNAAYAHTDLGCESYVARFTSLAEIEPWIAAGNPVIVSLGWGQAELNGAPIPASSGHLMVLVGFDADGNPVLNDPAAPDDASVQRVYPRAAFETLWLKHSGGATYLIYPPGHAPSLTP